MSSEDPKNSLLKKELTEEDKILDLTLRPKTWPEYVGQEKIKKNVKIIIEAAKQRKEPCPEHLLFYGGSGLGKCIHKDSIVFTEKGMLPLGNLGNLNKKGLQPKKIQVYSNPGPVLISHFYNNKVSKTLRITTHQRFKIEGTPNHPIVTLKEGKMLFKQLQELRQGDCVAIQRGQEYFGNATRLPKFTFIPKERNYCNYDQYTVPTHLTPGLARLLGYLIGDGYIGKKSGIGTVHFHNENLYTLRNFQKLWFKLFNQQVKISRWKRKCPVIRASNMKIREFLLGIGLSYSTAATKKIPPCIMQAPAELVREFLRAYFECDGHVRPNCRQAEISSASETLLREVQMILLNFGIISRLYLSIKRGKKGGPSWRLSITGGDVDSFLEKIGFISRKKTQVRKNFSPIKNTNKDLVPFGKAKIREIKNLLIRLNKSLQKKHYRKSARGDVSHQEIENCLNKIYEAWDAVSGKIEEIKKISSPTIFWDKIEKIEKGLAHTVDLVVPTTHAFFANGFINHNTTISHLIAKEMGSNIRVTSGPAIERAGDLASILTNLSEGDVLFVDELHRLNKICEEMIYPALEEFKLNLILGKGPMARTMEIPLPRFTLIGATTRIALLSSPLRSRFGATFQLNFYEQEDIEKIIQRSAKLLEVEAEPEAVKTIAQRARFTPRVANRLLKRVRDFAQVEAEGKITEKVAKQALDFLEIDEKGLEIGDRKILEALIQKFDGGPVGLKTLSAATSEEEDTILDIYEPYLMQLGFLERTSRGRMATKLTYKHLGIKYKGQRSLI